MKRIEELLNRRLRNDELHSVPTLNDVTPTMIEELKKLESGSQIDFYLSFYLAEKYTAGHGRQFVDDVVKGGVDPKTWGFRDAFVCLEESGPGHLVRVSWDDFEHELGNLDGTRWWWHGLAQPAFVNQTLSAGSWGMVGVRVEHVPYWWQRPKRTIDLSCDDELGKLLKRVDDASARILFRRWIASRCSWWCRVTNQYSRDSTPENADDILALLGVARGALSKDGAIAVRALAREAQRPFDPDHDVRGFVGPDAWYCDD